MMETNQGVPVAESDAVAAEEGVEPTREDVNQQIAEHLLAIGMLGSIHRIPEIGQCVGRLGLLFAELESMP